MTEPSKNSVRSYYDARVAGKLGDFTHVNPRIEAAIDLIAEWAPLKPSRVLEIGCSVGATSWRMARAWPDAEIVGVDISPTSIDVARSCFRLPNLSYQAMLVEPGVLAGKFDLIVMMDVYEHIAIADRPMLHAAILSLLSEDSRFIITVPTPALQHIAGDQPIDEDVDIDEIKTICRDIQAELLYYRKLGIWAYGDYAHIVFGRYQEFARVALRQQKPGGGRQWLKSLLGIDKDEPGSRRDYLGRDVGAPSRNVRERFRVSVSERRKMVRAWESRAIMKPENANRGETTE